MFFDRRVDEEEYEPSSCCEKEIDFYYPEGRTPSDPRFEVDQILLQKALMACHVYLMSPADKRRAERTFIYLNKKLRGENGYW